MNILAFDLELNQDVSGPKIIEVGACVGDLRNGEVLEMYSAFVNPEQALTPEIIQLTGIQQAQVDNAASLAQAYLGMEMLAKRYECLTLPLVWGVGDGHALRQALPLNCPWRFGRRELDVKAVFQAYQMSRGEKVQAGLAKALTYLALNFKGRKHRANDDAVNTFIIYHALLKRFM